MAPRRSSPAHRTRAPVRDRVLRLGVLRSAVLRRLRLRVLVPCAAVAVLAACGTGEAPDGDPRPSGAAATASDPARNGPDLIGPDLDGPDLSDYPGAGSTGVPPGTQLEPYRGALVVDVPGTVIDASRVTGTLTVAARDVVVTRSSVRGAVVVTAEGSLTLSDSTVDGGTLDGAAVGQQNLTMRRVEVVGARQSVSCVDRCDVQDSWLHAQYIAPGSDWHGNGFVSNGGSHVVLRHNTLACDSQPTGAGGACSAALSAYGDFAPIQDHTYEDNLFLSSPAGYCLYGGFDPAKPYGADASDVVISGNVFERGASGACAVFGPVAAIAPEGNGNVFRDNVWDDGSPVPPS